MKIFRRIAIFIGGGLILTGVFLMILSAAFGGKIDYSSGKERIDVDTEYENVTSIDIDYQSGSILIKQGEKFKVVAKNVLKNRFQSSVTDGVWTITDNKDSTFSFLSNFGWKKDSTVTIYIPGSVTLDDCKFTLGAGKIEADSIRTKTFNVQVGAGSVNVKDLTAEDSELDCGVGSISIEGVLTGDSDIKSGVGEINLKVSGDLDAYDYNLKVGIGSIEINDIKYSGVNDKEINNDNSTGSFKLDCGIGKIIIEIK